MLKYKTAYYLLSTYGGPTNPITPVEVLGETDKFVMVKSGRGTRWEAKFSACECYFDTWEEAKDQLLHRAKSDVEDASKALASAEKRLMLVNELKPE